MSYESEERDMVQGIEADAKKWTGHHDELNTEADYRLFREQVYSNPPPPEGSCGTCAYKLAVCRAAECMTTHHSLYKPVRKENDEANKIHSTE